MSCYFLTLRTDENFKGNLLKVLNVDGISSTKTFDNFLEEIADRLEQIVEEYAEESEVKEQGEFDIGDVFGFKMSDDWKVNILEDICDRADPDEKERMICEYGLMKAIRSTEREMTIKELGTDDGISDLFNDVMWDLIELADGVKEVSEEEYRKHFPNGEESDKDDEDEDEDDEDNEDDEDDEDDEDEDELWEANLMKGDANSALMKEAMQLYPDDREACINYISVKSCGTFNGLVSN
jgi:hypothetical protein